ncbi:MAG: hypothetical protein KBT02_08975 [Treponema sp.]|nr:hypothetical protein [Candidatus Treponema caballi]
MWDTGVKDENGKNIAILLVTAPDYLTPEFYDCLNVFYMTENIGCLPFAGGWADQPYWIAQALSVLKVEQNLWDRREIDEKTKAK